jgi:anti-repressor protein
LNDTQVFTFKAFAVRAVTKNGEPWFVAADVCNVLGIGNSRDAMGRLPATMRDDVGITDTIGRNQIVNAVNEAGLYKLAFTSRKPEAEAFTDWVASDVLPAIRKHGMYATPATVEAMLADPDTMIKTLQALKDERVKRLAAETALSVAAPKAAVLEAWTGENNTDLITIEKLAKMLAQYNLGRNRLYAYLRGKAILDGKNTPYQRYIDAGYFVVTEIPGWTEANTGRYHPLYQTKITARGKEYITKMVLAERKAQAN